MHLNDVATGKYTQIYCWYPSPYCTMSPFHSPHFAYVYPCNITTFSMCIQIEANTTNQLPNLLSNASYNAWAPPDSHPLWYTLVCYTYSKCTLYVRSVVLCICLPALITPKTFLAQCAQCARPLHKTCKENQLLHLLSITTWCKSTPWLTYHFGTPWFVYSECTLHTWAALLCILLPTQITPNILNLMRLSLTQKPVYTPFLVHAPSDS